MASSSGVNNQHGSSVHAGEWGVPTFQHQQIISTDWTPEEQAKLEAGLDKYSSESNIIRYAKIAVQLKNKTVRDVALRCRWMTKKEINKKRKEDLNAKKNKDRKEMVIDCPGNPSRLANQAQPGSSSHTHPEKLTITTANDHHDFLSYNNNADIGGAATRQLLQQNAWTFQQISSNLATHQMHENIGLLSKARENIFQMLANMNNMGPTMKKMAPLPKLNEALANSILPPSNYNY